MTTVQRMAVWVLYSLVLVITILALIAATRGHWIQANLWATSALLRITLHIRPPAADAKRIVVVKEDDESRNRLGGDLREFHPRLLTILSHPLIRVVAFDHDYQQGSPFNEQFAAAIRKLNNRVVVGSDTSVPEIRTAARHYGHLGRERFFGSVTHIAAARVEDGHCVASFAVATVAVFFSLDDPELKCADGVVLGPSFRILTDARNRMAISYVDLEERLISVRYADLLDQPETIMSELTKDSLGKIVLVGTVGENDRRDTHNTPVGQMAGVEIQASAIDTILRARYTKELPEEYNWIFLPMLIMLVNVLTLRVRWERPSDRVPSTLPLVTVCAGLMLAYLCLSALAFVFASVKGPIALYLATISVTSLINIGLDRRGWLPDSIQIPAKELVSMPSAFLVLLIFGRTPMEAVCIAFISGVLLWALPRIPASFVRVVTVVLVAGATLCLTPLLVHAQSARCGQIMAIVDPPARSTGKSQRIIIERGTTRVKTITDGDSVYDGDQMFLQPGISFRLDWGKGSSTAVQPRTPGGYRLEVKCREKLFVVKLGGFFGRILAFVMEGGSLEIIPDDRGKIGTVETIFVLRQEEPQTSVYGIRGKVLVKGAGEAMETVQPLEVGTLDSKGQTNKTQLKGFDDLKGLRDLVLETLRLANLSKHRQALSAVAIVETEIGLLPGLVRPTIQLYETIDGDTIDRIVERHYPPVVRGTGAALALVRQQVLAINPWIEWIERTDRLKSGQSLLLPTIRPDATR